MTPSPELSVVVPVFNERDNIPPLVDEIVARAVALLDAERGFGVVFEEQAGPAVVSTVASTARNCARSRDSEP